MPVVFDEVTADVQAPPPTREEQPREQAPPDPFPQSFQRESKRQATRKARLHAD
jgi:hypothetical protein